jgi:hypothetical protein
MYIIPLKQEFFSFIEKSCSQSTFSKKIPQLGICKDFKFLSTIAREIPV